MLCALCFVLSLFSDWLISFLQSSKPEGRSTKYKVQSTSYGVTPTTGLNFTDAPSLFVRKRIRGAVEETEFEA